MASIVEIGGALIVLAISGYAVYRYWDNSTQARNQTTEPEADQPSDPDRPEHSHEPSEPDVQRRTLAQDTGETKIEISLFTSTKLDQRRGRIPEVMMARYAAQALDAAGFDYKIDIGYSDTADPPQDRPGSDIDTYRWWVDQDRTPSAHVNMLLLDATGGGRAGLHEVWAIHGQNRTKDLQEATQECFTDQCRNIWGGLHEIGHSLGGKHTTPMMQDKPAMLFSEEMVALIQEHYG